MMARAAAAVAALLLFAMPSFAKPLRVVAIGASNTQGFYIGKEDAYPAQLQKLLRQNGIHAEVINSGVPFDTTTAMLRRIDSDVPKGTDIAILQPGANDRRFFGSREQRAANIAEMERRLRARGIDVVVYDEDIPLRYYTFDFIHLTREGHAMIAAALLPKDHRFGRASAPGGAEHRGAANRPLKLIRIRSVANHEIPVKN